MPATPYENARKVVGGPLPCGPTSSCRRAHDPLERRTGPGTAQSHGAGRFGPGSLARHRYRRLPSTGTFIVEWLASLRGATVGLDMAPIIYFIERNPAYVAKLSPYVSPVPPCTSVRRSADTALSCVPCRQSCRRLRLRRRTRFTWPQRKPPARHGSAVLLMEPEG
jgi:hypothetical protein